jgi:hypothetical protein
LYDAPIARCLLCFASSLYAVYRIPSTAFPLGGFALSPYAVYRLPFTFSSQIAFAG